MSLVKHGFQTMYKGTFLSYVDENYLESGNFEAYIYIPDLILSNQGNTVLTENINTTYIRNKNELDITDQVHSVNSIICQPLYINNTHPIVEENEEVFVFIFDEDPKKIFYALISTNVREDKRSKFILRIGHSLVYVDKDEIRLVHELSEDENDNSITVSEHGVEVVSENFIVNGVNMGDLSKLYATMMVTNALYE